MATRVVRAIPLALLSVTLLGCPRASYAQGYDPKSFAIDESILSGAKTMLETSQAMRKEYDRAEGVMAQMLLQVKQQRAESPWFGRLIDREQSDWQEYVNGHISTIFPTRAEGGPLDTWGSIQPYLTLRFKAEMIWERVKVLYRWLSGQYEDGMYGWIGR